MPTTQPLPRHIIWDWNGTLLNDLELTVRSVNVVLEHLGRPEVSCSQYREVYTHPIRNVYHALGIEMTDEAMEQAAGLWHQSYCQHVGAARLFEDVRSTLSAARERVVGQSILSALPQAILQESVDRHDLRHFFGEVLGLSDLLGRSKIDNGHRLLATISKNSCIQPSEILLIGDSTHDVEVAEVLGLQCALVSRGYESEARLAAHKWPVWENFNHLQQWLATAPAA